MNIASHGLKTGGHKGGITTLVLDGDIILESLDLAGSLAINAAPGARVIVKSLQVANDGYEIEDRPTDAGTPELVRMRGFQLTGEENTLSFDFAEPGTYVIEDGDVKKISDTADAQAAPATACPNPSCTCKPGTCNCGAGCKCGTKIADPVQEGNNTVLYGALVVAALAAGAFYFLKRKD